jgi:hypothetical protein
MSFAASCLSIPGVRAIEAYPDGSTRVAGFEVLVGLAKATNFGLGGREGLFDMSWEKIEPQLRREYLTRFEMQDRFGKVASEPALRSLAVPPK